MFPSTQHPRATQIPQSVAALVDNIQAAAGKTKHTAPNKQQLKQLLDEFFDADNQISSIGSSAAGYGGDNSTHLKLIEVVTSLGISVLLEDDPFASPAEGSFTEATNSLFLIRRVILQTPFVLLETVETADSSRAASPRPPLYLWLAVRLLPVLACGHTVELVPHLIQTLQCILASLHALPEGWNACRILMQFCTGSLESLITKLKTRPAGDGVFRVKLPGEGFMNTYKLAYGEAVSFVVREVESAITVVGRIFSVLSICLAPTKELPQVSWQNINAVLFERVTEMWRIVKVYSWNQSLATPLLTFKQELLGVLIRLLDAPLGDNAKASKTCNLALRILIDTLGLPAEEISQSLESALSAIILQLLFLSRTKPSLSQSIILRVRPLISGHASKKTSWDLFQKDFQRALAFCLYHTATQSTNRQRALELITAGEDGHKWGEFKDKELEERAKKLEEEKVDDVKIKDEDVEMIDEGEGARKRRKLSKSDGSGRLRKLVRELYHTLGDLEAEDVAGLTSVLTINFPRLEDSSKSRSMQILGLLSCLSSTQATTDLSLPTDLTDWSQIHCAYCDSSEHLSPSKRKMADRQIVEESFSCIEKLYGMDEFQGSIKARIWAMMSLRRVLNHSRDVGRVNIASSLVGKWTLQSLQSTRRELRIAAGRTLPCFIVGDVEDPDVLQRNRHIVMDFMRTYAEGHEPTFAESCLLAFAEIVKVSEKVELELSLLRLIDYLGHGNNVIMGMAYNELEKLSHLFKQNLRRIMLPFMRTLSVSIIRTINSRPQIVQHLSDLMGKTVDEIIMWASPFAIPYMVLMKKKDIIERIVKAYGKGMSTGALLTRANNLSPILALLLTQPYEDVEKNAINSLRAVSDNFAELTLPELLRSHEIATAAELLKSYTGAGDDRSVLVHRAIRILATHCVRLGRGKVKDAELLPLFFEQNALGIMAQFSDEIHDIKGKSSSTEKARILKGIEGMLVFAKSSISHALPQMCACLQSALETSAELRSGAIDAWSAIFSALSDSEIVPLLVQTISVIMQFWHDFDEEIRNKCFVLIGTIFDKYALNIEENAASIPTLKGIQLFVNYQAKIESYKARLTIQDLLAGILRRCKNDNGAVVDQALIELEATLEENSHFIHATALSDSPDPIFPEILRCLLDIASERKSNHKTEQLLARCLGLIGAVDPARVNIARNEEEIFVLHNFTLANESVKFIVHFLEDKLVPAFLSSTDTKGQGFLAYTMQELLKFCGFGQQTNLRAKPDRPVTWDSLSTSSRNALAPFLNSKYVIGGEAMHTKVTYPVLRPQYTHRIWLQTFLMDLLMNASGEQAQRLFNVCSKVIKGQDIGISTFLLPYIVLNIVIGGENPRAEKHILSELMTVLTYNLEDADPAFRQEVKHCSETVFMLVDKLSRWLDQKNKYNQDILVAQAKHANRRINYETDQDVDDISTHRVSKFLSKLPVDIMGLRSFECNAYARALRYWEEHIRNESNKPATKHEDMEPLYQKLQMIYAQIDEPDGIEGISTKLNGFTIEQQIVEHSKAGRWGPVQVWYEKRLKERPGDAECERELLNCLRETGQYENIMLNVESYLQQHPTSGLEFLPAAVEAAWSSENWMKLEYYLEKVDPNVHVEHSFELLVGQALSALRRRDFDALRAAIAQAQEEQIKQLSPSVTGSIRQCRDILVRLQMLTEIEVVSAGVEQGRAEEYGMVRSEFYATLQRRLDILGSSSAKDKQRLLAARRAVFQLSGISNPKEAVASMFLTSGRLARKSGQTRQAFAAVVNAEALGSPIATIEHCKLLWDEGNHRKAITSLEAALAAQILANAMPDVLMPEPNTDIDGLLETGEREGTQNFVVAKASLMHAKWLDHAGQSHSAMIVERYQRASKCYLRWEQGHYYLGWHYNKLYHMEEALPLDRRTERFSTGEYARLVCQCYLRAAAFGTKYVYQTVPRFLTLWLDFGELMRKPGDQLEGQEAWKTYIIKGRRGNLTTLHASVKKYIDRLASYVWYIAYSQMLSRVTHQQEQVYEQLQRIIVKIAVAHPKQALWSLLAVCKSTQKDRSTRGNRILQIVKDATTMKPQRSEIRGLINSAMRMNADLLYLANFEIVGKQITMSLSHDIFKSSNFINTPCALVVPAKAVLTVSMPAEVNPGATFSAFPSAPPYIAGVQDDCDIMNSLQKPRKITIRGSDGHVYPFLVKPKDDLRKDARLMEFDNMINRVFKKDPDSSLRNLYIRTYHVTPLNEECGLIEWVNNMRPLREIIFKGYKAKGIEINYNEIRALLEESSVSDDKTYIFTDVVLPKFRPVFYSWFVSRFPEPGAWLAARLAYTRTTAVMSIVGHMLGLGDRHGENILYDETNGDCFHVDFNCLFEKGQTFDKPEKVPFRLTQNMVDAFGVCGYEGPFRRTCEVSTRIFRAHEETLMTVLETFLHDPAVDMIRRKKSGEKKEASPKDMLDVIRAKLQGRFTGETVPLSVEGQVQELIRSAVSPKNLKMMYIGWMSFF